MKNNTVYLSRNLQNDILCYEPVVNYNIKKSNHSFFKKMLTSITNMLAS